uniref:Putative secreted protein n=1 Tax=Amblyomma cajennense TaxID=34607 RepID=A0A023FB66_AMBCJ
MRLQLFVLLLYLCDFVLCVSSYPRGWRVPRRSSLCFFSKTADAIWQQHLHYVEAEGNQYPGAPSPSLFQLPKQRWI